MQPIEFAQHRRQTRHPWFNDNGSYAQGVRVGLIDGFRDRDVACGIDTLGEPFQHLSAVQYQYAPISCAFDEECAHCSSYGEIGRCVASDPRATSDTGEIFPTHCVAPHPTMVASRIASSWESNPYHAAGVHLLVANAYTPAPFGGIDSVALQNYAEAYDWLSANGATFVNESVQYLESPDANPYDVFAEIRSHFEINSKMLTVKVTGNNTDWIREGYGDEADCGPNDLCVSAYHETPYAASAPSPYNAALWRNPRIYDGDNFTTIDVERPDLVADDDGDYWYGAWNNGLEGTSFAAPVVTGILALCQGSRYGPTWRQPGRLWRAVMRTYVQHFWPFPEQPCDDGALPAYPTARSPGGAACDYKWGVGPATVAGMRDDFMSWWWCEAHDWPEGEPGSVFEPGPSESDYGSMGSGEGLLEFSADIELIEEEEVPAVDCTHSRIEDDNTVVTDCLVRPAFYSAKVGSIAEPRQGNLVRATLVFDQCPWEELPGRDIDLRVYGIIDGSRELIAKSESVYDTVEGLQILVPQDYDRIDFRAVWPEREGGNGFPQECYSGQGNPYALAWRVLYW